MFEVMQNNTSMAVLMFISRLLLSSRLLVEDDSVVLGLEPLHCVLLDEAVRTTHAVLAAPPLSNVLAGAAKHHVEVHAIDSNAGVVLYSQIDMFQYSKPKVSSVREIFPLEFIFFDLEASFQNLLGLRTSYCAVDSDLFIPSYSERSDSVSGFGKYRSLPGQSL